MFLWICPQEIKAITRYRIDIILSLIRFTSAIGLPRRLVLIFPGYSSFESHLNERFIVSERLVFMLKIKVDRDLRI